MTSIANTALQSIMREARNTLPSRFDTSYFLGAIDAMSKHFEPDPDLVKEAHETVHELRRRYGPP